MPPVFKVEHGVSPTSRDVPCRRCPCRRLPGSLLHLVNGCSDGRLVTCRVFPPRTPGGPGVRVRLAVLHSAWLQWVSPVAAPRTRVGMSFRPDLLPAGSPRWRSQAVDYGHGNVGSTRLDRTLASSHARTYPASPEKKKKKKKSMYTRRARSLAPTGLVLISHRRGRRSDIQGTDGCGARGTPGFHLPHPDTARTETTRRVDHWLSCAVAVAGRRGWPFGHWSVILFCVVSSE